MPLIDVQIDRGFKSTDQRAIGSSSRVDEETRTIHDVCFTTGQRGLRYDWSTGQQYYEELEVSDTAIRKSRLDKGLSVIDSHDTWRGLDGVFGITLNEYRIENGELIGSVRFSDDEDSDKNYKKVRSGVLKHTSLGYNTYRMKYMGDAPDGIPVYRAVDWEPTELSFVPVSFETTNGVRNLDNNAGKPTALHKCEIDIEDENMSLPFTRMTRGANSPAPQSNPEPEAPVIEQAPTPDAGTRDNQPAPAPIIQQTSRKDIAGEMPQFLTIGRRCNIDDQTIIEKFGSGMSLADFRAFALDQLGNDSENNVHARTKGEHQDQAQKERESAALYLMSRNHVGTAAPIQLTDMARGFQGMKLMDLARHFTKIGFGSGLSQHAIAQRAFQTTSDFSLILENVMHKMLQSGYMETARTFVGIPQVQNASDFREQHVYRLGDAPNLLPLNEDGEYESGSFGSEKESFHIETRARKIGVSRQALINDDMSALSILPYMFGQAGSRMESDMFWGMVLNYDFINNKAAAFKMRDGKHLFDKTNHKNVIDGAASALSKDALSDIRKIGRNMKTVDGNYMNVEWNTFVFPHSLETKADDLLSGNVYAATADNINSFRGRYSDTRIEPRLEAVADGDKAWFAFSNMIRAFVISYLDGQEGIYSEVINSTDSDGLYVLARKDFGVGMVDFRGAAKAIGK